MPLNAEEKYEHEKFKQKQYARPTLEQLEIARLEQQLQHAQNTIQYLDDHIEKLTDQLDDTGVNGQIDKKRLIERVENYIPLHDKTVGDVMNGILEIIKQLPELEVLSPDWIDENQHPYGGDYQVPSEKLEDLLVPKQEITGEQAKDALEEKGYTIARMYDSDNETSESKTFDNKLFNYAQPIKIEVSQNKSGEVLICESLHRAENTVMWLSNETALDLATWILDNVSEVDK